MAQPPVSPIHKTPFPPFSRLYRRGKKAPPFSPAWVPRRPGGKAFLTEGAETGSQRPLRNPGLLRELCENSVNSRRNALKHSSAEGEKKVPSRSSPFFLLPHFCSQRRRTTHVARQSDGSQFYCILSSGIAWIGKYSDMTHLLVCCEECEKDCTLSETLHLSAIPVQQLDILGSLQLIEITEDLRWRQKQRKGIQDEGFGRQPATHFLGWCRERRDGLFVTIRSIKNKLAAPSSQK